MKQFAVFSRDKTSYSGKDFQGFLDANTLEEAQTQVDKSWFECDCDNGGCSCDEEEEYCQCVEEECDCEWWAVEVANDVIGWDWNYQTFYTQKDVDDAQLKSAQSKLDFAIRQLIKTNDIIVTMLQEKKELQEEIEMHKQRLEEVKEVYEEKYGK